MGKNFNVAERKTARANKLRNINRIRPQIIALEPRIMFDGAAAADVAQATSDAPDQTSADTSSTDNSTATQDITDTPPAVIIRIADPDKNNGRKEVAFIDISVENYQTLVNSIREGVEVVLLASGQSGLQQMADWAQTHSGFDAIHILSHGEESTIYLGSDKITNTQLSDVTIQSKLIALGQSLNAEGDLMIYGCSVASGNTGQTFINNLATLTGADVAASSDFTGAVAKGGDWVLEATSGEIETDALALNEANDYQHLLAAYTATFIDGSSEDTNNPIIRSIDTGEGPANFTFDAGKTYGSPQYTKNSLQIEAISGNSFVGLYAGSTRGSSAGVDLTITAQAGFTFDLDGFDAYTQYNWTNNGSWPITVYYVKKGVEYSVTYTSAVHSVQTKSLLAATFNDVSIVTISCPWNCVFNNIVIKDVKVPPAITSATYDAATNSLVVTGKGFSSVTGANNDIDVSKLSLTGEGGNTYTLTSANVEIDSTTQFTIFLNAADQTYVEGLLNKDGTSAVSSTVYNIAAADDWLAYDPGYADLTGNGISVSHVAAPTVSGASYDASTGVLTVSGAGFVKLAGANNDITANKLTLTGEGGVSYTLSDTANVEITNGTSFTLTLSATDKAAINQIMNKAGTSSTSGTAFNLALADDWNTVITGGDISDTTGNAITVSNPTIPTLTSATYDAASGVLVVTGTGFLKLAGANNDIDVSKLTLAGEGASTYTLTSANVEITNGTSFTVLLNATDLAALNQIFNKTGTTATGGASYNLAAAEDWAAGADSAVNVVDLTGNAITLSNPTIPVISSSSYDATTGVLTITGTGFLKLAGANNDIIANKFTFTGEGGDTYTLTDTANVEITSGTAATLTLSATDRARVNMIINKTGSSSTSADSYNIAAAEDWAAGAESSVTVADLTLNAITVANVVAPTITSASYDSKTGELLVTGIGFLKKTGISNDIDLTKLTLTGKAAGTYTLSSTDVEIASGTSFKVILNDADKNAINLILNIDGLSSGSTIYNISAAGGWNRGSDIPADDLTGNSVKVSGYAIPKIENSTSNSVVQPKISPTPIVKTLASINPAYDDIEKNLHTILRENTATQIESTSGLVQVQALTSSQPGAFQVAVVSNISEVFSPLSAGKQIKDMTFDEGNRISLVIFPDAFTATKTTTSVYLTATLVDGSALPSWLSFDPQSGTIEGSPPTGFNGRMIVKLSARDSDGNVAIQTFAIKVGKGEKQKLSQNPIHGSNDEISFLKEEASILSTANTRSIDSKPMTKEATIKQIGRLSLTQQLKALSQEGRIAKQAALLRA